VATSLGRDTSTWQGLFIEMKLTGQLIFTILMLAVEKRRATFLAPLGIGLALFVGRLIGNSRFNQTFENTAKLCPCRNIYYRSRLESCTGIWPFSRHRKIRHLSLDILARSLLRSDFRSRLPQTPQVPPISNNKFGPG
jgi:Major intrinsic protein